MKIKLFGLTVVLIAMTASLCWSSTDNGIAGSESQSALLIQLPSKVSVENENLTLGQIAVVTGQESIATKARAIGLGRIPVAGQKVTIARSLIASRLACSEASVGKPVFLGADEVVVSRTAKVIKSGSFVESAKAFLADNVRDDSIVKWEAARAPVELVVPDRNQNIELSSYLVSRGANGQAVVEVNVVEDGKQIDTRQVVLRPKYNARRVVTVSEVPAGAMLTADNTRIEKVISDEPEAADWAAPYGLVAARRIPTGTVITAAMARTPKAQVVIERNQTVVIKIERPGLVVTGMGKAMEQGKLGQCIKVRNIDSQRVILARVNEDGTVEPAL